MLVKPIQIGTIPVGPGHPPVVVAEISGNHNGSLDRALEIVDAIGKTGAQAVKLQTYTAKTMTLPLAEHEFFVSDPNNQWTGQSLYDLYEKAHTPWEWHRPIMERCRANGLVVFSSPFDATAVDFLEELEVPCYKIASFEIIDLPLIRRVAATGKPVIISTGMASVSEIAEAVDAARDGGCKDLVLMKCTSTYPANPKNTHLRTIGHLTDLFHCLVGLSDHTLGIGAAVAAVAFGAVMVEKHVTLDRHDGGVDSSFSLEPAEMKGLYQEVTRAWEALGDIHYGPTEDEKSSLQYRRSLYIIKNMQAGEIFSENNVRAIRPGLGLAPKFQDAVMGRRAARNIGCGTPLAWDLIG